MSRDTFPVDVDLSPRLRGYHPQPPRLGDQRDLIAAYTERDAIRVQRRELMLLAVDPCVCLDVRCDVLVAIADLDLRAAELTLQMYRDADVTVFVPRFGW